MELTSDSIITRKPQAIAWIVVLGGFVLFLTICGLGTFGTYWFFFESTVPLTAQVSVSQGIVGMTVANQPTNVSAPNYIQPVSTSAVLTVPGGSQGYLTFTDGKTNEILALVLLLPNSAVEINDISRPRFEWSSGPYSIDLENINGNFRVTIPPRPGSNRPLTLFMHSAQGTILLSDPGVYNLRADAQMRLEPQYGQGLLYALKEHAGQVQAGNVGVVSASAPDVKVTPSTADLLMGFNYGTPLSAGKMPTFWACSSLNASGNLNEPQGSWVTKLFEQQMVLYMNRQGDNLSHNDTSCSYEQPAGLDVTGYNGGSLSIHAQLRIHAQDVPTCGIQATECPVMIELDYLDHNNQPQTWHQGFYFFRPAYADWPLRCDTCPSIHVQINPDSWYYYDSGNLLAQFTNDLRPTAITKLRIYASGHQFDVDVAELALLGGKQP